MRFLFSSTRGAGHVQPLIPYARALAQLGHEVVVAAPESVASKLSESGLSHAIFDHPGDEALKPLWSRLNALTGGAQLSFVMREIFGGRCAEVALPRLLETLRAFAPDVVVRESAEFASLVAAESLGITHARVSVHMASFEEPLEPHMAEAVDVLRARVGMAADAGSAIRAEPVFAAFPASLEDPAVVLAGRVPLRSRMPQLPTSAHAAWASSVTGKPLVYITFGTIAGGSPQTQAVYRAAIEAVADLPVRALLTTGPAMQVGALGVVPGNVEVETWVPQAEVLPHAALVVCHGGSGTVLGALAAGVPMVVSPFGADQPHNGEQLARTGAGVVASGDATSLRAAILRGLDGSLRPGARQLADEIARMPSLGTAVDAMLAMSKTARS